MEGVSMSDGEWTRVGDEGLVQVPYSISSTPEMSGSVSPTSFGPFRRGSRSDHSHSMWSKENSPSGIFSGSRTHKSSQKSKDYGKRQLYAQDSAQEGYTSPTASIFSFGSTDGHSHSRYQVSSPERRPPVPSASPTKKAKGNLFEAASGALNLRFGRKKSPIIRQPQPMPIILPGVIEISAPRRDEEDEERNRLRETAAQSIGYPINSPHDSHSLEDSAEDDELDDEDAQDTRTADIRDTASSIHHRTRHHARSSSASFGGITNAHSSNVSIPTSPTSPAPGRPGSVLRHTRTNSVIPVLVPTFPCELRALNQLKQSEVTLHKFYPASSLRIFALSKNWRSRCMVLTVPTSVVKRNSAPPVSYLHLFKAAGGDEIELERLEINEDSVVFVAEEDVAGRKHVVKVAGEDVGARKKELVHEEAGRTMWYLHIEDPNEAQMWITSIKSAILSQRTIRAGLGVAGNNVNAFEPRGDMDVMLSMRAQRLINSPPSSPTTTRPSTSNGGVHSQSDRNSISSHRSQTTVSKTLSAGIKGLFTGSTRPRSASRATSVESHDRDSVDESFGSRGTHLMRGSEPISPVRPVSRAMQVSQSAPPEHPIDKKIMPDRINFWAAEPPTTTSAAKERASRTLSLQGGAIALQPPPRKRWTSVGPTSQSVVPLSSPGTSRLSPLGDTITPEQESEASSPKVSVFHFTPEQTPREPSILSVSTLASSEAPTAEDRASSSGTKRSSKRWSRQSVLPRRLTPPTGPPPAAPTISTPGSSASQISVPSLGDRRKSQSSTHSTASTRQSVLPSFTKRTSGSSFLSLSGPGASQSPSASRPTSSQSHRLSMPPPRPAPTSALPPAPNGASNETDLLGDVPPLASSMRSNKRDSTNKAFRLSLLSQRPLAPPSSALPPRPDEARRPKGQRRNSSADIYRRSARTSLDMIPGSPIPSPLVLSPFPPPDGPLPPTPAISGAAVSASPPRATTRQSSLKKRLRILSAPSSSQGGGSRRRSLPPAPLSSPQGRTPAYSPPDTPIGEKILQNQDDPSFLQMDTPTVPSLPSPRLLSRPLLEPEVLVTPLSPPPRRGSRQIMSSELPTPYEAKVPLEERLKPVSRPGSVISLGIVSM